MTLALLPRNSLTRWLTLATLVPALLHFSAGTAGQPPGRPGPDPVDRGPVPGLGRRRRRRAAALVRGSNRIFAEARRNQRDRGGE